MNIKDLTNKRFGKLTAVYPTDKRKNGKIVWHCLCDCGNEIDVSSTYLSCGDTKSCGCIKQKQNTDNLRKKYDAKRVNGIAIQLFKEQEPRKDSTTGFHGVQRYYTRANKKERYLAHLTVKGKLYRRGGFFTPEDAYYYGRLELEKEYLPPELRQPPE